MAASRLLGSDRRLRPFSHRGALWAVAVWLIVGTGVLAPEAQADWINLSGAEVAPHIAEVHVDREGVQVDLEIFPPQSAAFADLLPESSGQPPSEGAQTTLSIRTPDRCELTPRVEVVEPRTREDRRSPYAGMINPSTGRRAPEPPADDRVLYLQLFYAFGDCGQPDALVIEPPTDADGIAAATIGFITYHAGVPVTDFRYLGSPVTLVLDWDDPWYSAFENPNLRRHHRYPVMSFIYAEPFEIRHEVLLRVRDAAELIGLQPAGSALTAEEIERLLSLTPELVAERSPMTIDGMTVVPERGRTAFMRVGLYGLEMLEDDEAVDVDATILGLIFSVPVEGLPGTASVEWTIYTDRIQEVPSTAIDWAGPMLGVLTPDDRVNVWTNYFIDQEDPVPTPVRAKLAAQFDVPVLSVFMLILGIALGIAAARARSWARLRWASAALAAVVVAGLVGKTAVVPVKLPTARLPSSEATAAVVAPLVENTGMAMLRPDDIGFDQALATFVVSDAVPAVGSEIRRGLGVTLPSGARARVDEIDAFTIEDVTAQDEGFGVLASWTSRVSGGHWGHAHRREIRYRALMDVVEIDGLWKLRGLTVLSARPSA
ncbi:MAG: hypothetical protein AAF637_20650 [Pseudomonadota bacterium]